MQALPNRAKSRTERDKASTVRCQPCAMLEEQRTPGLGLRGGRDKLRRFRKVNHERAPHGRRMVAG
jgi:hypothetical protein